MKNTVALPRQTPVWTLIRNIGRCSQWIRNEEIHGHQGKREFAASLAPTLVHFSTDLAIPCPSSNNNIFLFQSLEAQFWQFATSLTSSRGGAMPNWGLLPSTLFLSLSCCLSQAHSGHEHDWLPQPYFPHVAIKLTCLFLFLTPPTWHSQLPWKPLVSCAKSHITLGTCSCQILEKQKM